MSTSHRVRRHAAVAVVLAGALLLPACSRDDNPAATDLVADAQAEQYAAEQGQQRQVEQALAALPQAPSGEVDIDGSSTISLTPEEVEGYRGTGTNTTINLAQNGEDEAFQQLCSGKIDIVSSLRSISRSEWDACQSVGLDVVQFQIASDAIVIAIKSESDVGGDCLTTDQVQEIWRAGSPVTNWSQVGLDDVPLKVGGPYLQSPDFQVFGKSVLGSLAPALTDVRSDYFTYRNFDEARRFINGGPRKIRIAQTYPERARANGIAKSEVVTARQVYLDARSELRIAKAERAKGIRDKRPAATQARDEARVQAAYVKAYDTRKVYRQLQRKQHHSDKRLKHVTKLKRLVDATQGHVIYARFSDYELFEEQLRPFEIDLPDGQINCVYPSQRTITGGEYPFASQLLITTTTRSLARPDVKNFLTYYLKDSQNAATRARLVSLPDETLSAQLAWLDGTRQPVLVVPSDDDTTTTTTATAQPSPTTSTDSPVPAR